MRLAVVALLALTLAGCSSGVSTTTVDGVSVLSAPAGTGDDVIEGALNLDKGCLVIVDTSGVPHGLVLPGAADVVATDGAIEVTIAGAAYGIHDAVRFVGSFGDSTVQGCEFDSYFTPNEEQ